MINKKGTPLPPEQPHNREVDPTKHHPQPDQAKRNAKVFTMYKGKDKKIHPVDDQPSDGSTPDGDPLWKVKNLAEAEKTMQPDEGPFRGLIRPKYSSIEPYSRLKPDRLAAIMDTLGHLLPREKDLFLQVLLNRENALAWDFSENGALDPKVAPHR
ncbi:uncharacterized protein ColSpa_06013 [Colletotrichum spaethianum]|uniref:Uncharacterized protein n=1 Tax=Colletotrichum spaethianum TaxID=700344 RepID=A0AA37NY40_9PEZI|nr:uncharacterized protein ColSpa_06013 [Colletotrichum spaethianum]GKT45832.1 hypothetical protein ColSpa_06013 [Colletotrichum spaethianum]